MSEVPPSSAPTYGSASRLAQIVHWLHQSPLGVTMEEIEERLAVSGRTLFRYVQVLKETLYDEHGDALVEVVRGEGSARLRFRRRGAALDASAMELMSLFLGLELMAFLEGTLFREGARGVMERLRDLMQRTGNHKAALMMKDFDRKFFHWSDAPKDYRHSNRQLETMIDALVRQRQIRLLYQAPRREPKTHLIAPLTLLMYKRGLYVVGRTQTQPQRDLTFAVERIREVTALEESFAYPIDYNPRLRFEHHFGLIGGDIVDLRLRFHPRVADNVASRTWHSSQKLERMSDGAVRINMHVALNEELVSWLLSYGSYVTVEQPEEVRQQLRTRYLQALEQL